MLNNMLIVRVTGLLIEEEKILIVKQKVSSDRNWSLPGGKVERGESLENAIIREIQEETGLNVEVEKLLYICENPEADPSLIHITFLLKRISGEIRMPSNEFETTHIYDVKMIPIRELNLYGFSDKFKEIVKNNFPGSGSYKGFKGNIGL